MDPIDPSETQSAPLNCRSIASNTSPFPCCCCSLNECPQAYCFRQTGLPKCTHFQDNVEEKFVVQQLLPSAPWLPPFFYNGAITPNYCFSHKPMNATAGGERQKHQEQDKTPQLANPCSAEKEKCGFRVNNTKLEEDSQRNNCILEPEPPLLGQPPYSGPDHHLNLFYRRCGCGDSLPWTCSSFIVPIISYCVLWNSEKPSTNSGNYSGNSPETFCQGNNKNQPNQTNSDPGNKVVSRNLVKDFNNNIAEGDGERDKCLGVDAVPTRIDWEDEEFVEQDFDRKSTRSFDSVNCTRENSFISGDRTENSTDVMNGADHVCVEEDSDEEEEDLEEDTDTSDPSGQSKKEGLKADVPHSKTNLLDEPQDSESQLASAAESLLDLKKFEKTCASATDLTVSDVEVSDVYAEDKHSENESKAQTKPTPLEKQISNKRFIKNFTTRDQTDYGHEEGQVPSAAAGDLGGINCNGYKVPILGSLEEDQQYKILQKTQTHENSQSKEIILKGLTHPEERKLETYSPRSGEKSPKPGKNFKSGIAIPYNSSKLKEAKGDATKNIKNEKREPSQVEPAAGRRKHSCFPFERAVGANENGSKIQKNKNLQSWSAANSRARKTTAQNDPRQKQTAQKT